MMPPGRPLTDADKEALALGRAAKRYQGTFTGKQLTRTINAVRDAGVQIAGIQLERGKAFIVFGTPPTELNDPRL